jgi:hypothetical protein
VTQPFDQKAQCEAAGKLDESIGEFWLENPWQPSDKNLSAYERNRVLINGKNGSFIDASHACGGADMDSDSRSVVAGDFNEDGMPDLLIRNSGGIPLRMFLNRFPSQNWIQISLRGSQSNSKGLGARVIARVSGQTLYREVQAANCFLGQSPSQLQLGLGEATEIEELQIGWPSGVQQIFRNVRSNAHYVVDEDDSVSLHLHKEVFEKTVD